MLAAKLSIFFKKRPLPYILCLLLGLLCGVDLQAQDLHFSQYYRTPIFVNPANTGASDHDLRLMAIARNQWALIPVSYNSLGVSADVNIPLKMNRDKVGIGLQTMADRAGDGRFTTLQASLASAYHFETGGVNFMILSIGASANYYQRSYDPYRLTFDNQFNGDYFDPTIAINEQFDRLNLSFFDFGLGVNYQQTFLNEHVLMIGGSLQHLLSQEQNFLNKSTNTILQPRFNMYVNGEFKVYKGISLIPLFFYQHQDKKYEVVTGAGIGINLAGKTEERYKIKLGTSLRLGDAFIPWIHWERNQTSIQFSYDFNTSPLRIASNSYGGAELSFGYLINFRKAKERQYDFCPYIWF